MKTKLKYYLSRNNLWPTIELMRRTPECFRWLQGGFCGIAPQPFKSWVISSYLRRFSLRHFVGTGTHWGDTLAVIANNQHVHCTSIELAESFFQEAMIRFASHPNVRLLQGDSGVLMPQVVAELREPALFWLDGHYSGGSTAKAGLETPISAELRAVLDSPISQHVILIDDIRCFNGAHDYPHLDDLLRDVRSDGRYSVEVSTDIARLTPRVST